MEELWNMTFSETQSIISLMAMHTETLKNCILIAVGIIVILGVAILWNQRKIKKQLRQLREMLEEQKDKP